MQRPLCMQPIHCSRTRIDALEHGHACSRDHTKRGETLSYRGEVGGVHWHHKHDHAAGLQSHLRIQARIVGKVDIHLRNRSGRAGTPSYRSVQVVQTWVVRVLGPASAYAIVPMVLDKTTGSSWMLAFSQRADVAADRVEG